MTVSFRIFSALLTYPRAELQSAVGEFAAVLDQEGLIPASCRGILQPLTDRIAMTDLVELQEDYVAHFDCNKSLSLHLFEHIHGESRDRGQAMIDLAEHYHAHGLNVADGELPDYLPMFLEFLSVLPADEATALLGEVGHVIGALGERLERRTSPYACVFTVLSAMDQAANSSAANSSAEKSSADRALATRDEVLDAAARDAEWEDAEILFGAEEADGDTGSCAKVDEILADLKRDTNRPGASRAAANTTAVQMAKE